LAGLQQLEVKERAALDDANPKLARGARRRGAQREWAADLLHIAQPHALPKSQPETVEADELVEVAFATYSRREA
jgi:hypothetical protein